MFWWPRVGKYFVPPPPPPPNFSGHAIGHCIGLGFSSLHLATENYKSYHVCLYGLSLLRLDNKNVIQYLSRLIHYSQTLNMWNNSLPYVFVRPLLVNGHWEWKIVPYMFVRFVLVTVRPQNSTMLVRCI